MSYYKDTGKDYLTFDNPQQQQVPLPNATAVLVLGILSIVFCIFYGVIAVILGIIALVLANKDKALYRDFPDRYSPGSLSNLNAGRTCAIIGLSLGILFIVVMVILLLLAVSITHPYRF